MSENGVESSIKRKYQDLSLDLNLDQTTADEAWSNYENIRLSYTLEGDQLPWLVCALYTAGRRCSVPTVGGRPGNMIQGNCVSLTRMLQHCNLPLTEFILKMKSWLAMSHLDEDFCRRVELLERNFAVSNNIFKKYKPIFLSLFHDPASDPSRPPRSRKQRRPPCNTTELFHFCWTLYILIKGKYPSIPQDLVSCYSLLLACIDLMYTNVITSNRCDLLNPSFEGLPEGLLDKSPKRELEAWPTSIMDTLCKKFDGVLVDTKVVREYCWKPNIKDLIESSVLKGTLEGHNLLEQINFDHNEKEVKKAYEEYLLSHGEFDERMFLTDTFVADLNSLTSSPRQVKNSFSAAASNPNKVLNNPSIVSARYNLSQTFSGDHHLVPQTPITGRNYTQDRPVIGTTPLSVITAGLQRLYALIAGRSHTPSEELLAIFRSLKNNPEEKITELVNDLSENFTKLYSQETEDFTAPGIKFTKMRLQMAQMLFYTFLEHILLDERKRGVDLEVILKEELFHRTLFTCCFEIVLKSYNDPRRFPWSLQVSKVDPYYFIRIIEPVIRSEKQFENQLSRELVNHLKGIEEQTLDSLVWRSDSPLWQILDNTGQGIPSCQDVNFSHQLETNVEMSQNVACSIMSPAVTMNTYAQQSPVSSLSEKLGSPGGQGGNARRMLFPTGGAAPSTKPSDILRPPPSLVGLGGRTGIHALNSQMKSFLKSPVAPQEKRLTPCIDISTSSSATPSASASATPAAASDSSATEKKKEKPKRHGSLALFFRRFYTLANMRLRDLCDRLDIDNPGLRQMIWTSFEHSIIHYPQLMKDRHMDQLIMCGVYITCKVTGVDKIFQEIMKHYRNQPQAASHVYRSVLISRNNENVVADGAAIVTGSEEEQHGRGAPRTPSQVTGTSSNLPSGERGDLIKFYNNVYVKKMKIFALKFRPTQVGDAPPLSPLPVLRLTPVSPRKKISVNHSVYINSLSSLSPLNSSSLSPKRPLPYYFNRSPAKNLRVINNMVKMQESIGSRKFFIDTEEQIQGVLQERQSSSPSTVSASAGLHNIKIERSSESTDNAFKPWEKS